MNDGTHLAQRGVDMLRGILTTSREWMCYVVYLPRQGSGHATWWCTYHITTKGRALPVVGVNNETETWTEGKAERGGQ